MTQTKLDISALRAVCDPKKLGFETTETLPALDALIGQSRAVDAIRLSAQIASPRFNLYVLGAEGSGRHSSIRSILQQEAARRPVPPDWVYVQNFDASERPHAIALPHGEGQKLRAAMQRLVEDLINRLPALLVSEDNQGRRAAIEQSFAVQHEAAFETLRKNADARGIAILRTPSGFSLAPARDGEVLKPEAIALLGKAERRRMEKDVAETSKELEEFLLSAPELQQMQHDALIALNTKIAAAAVDSALKKALRAFERIASLRSYFSALREDLIKHAELFVAPDLHASDSPFPVGLSTIREDLRFRRYDVNVIVSHADKKAGAPVIEETLPNLANLTGRIDSYAKQGALSTDFTLIRPGALHRANGGFLILDARRLLSEPFAWDALKRCLETGQVRLTSEAERMGLISTTSLEPQPTALSVRVILVGDRELHSALTELDPDFGVYFQVLAEFADDAPRTNDSMKAFARVMGTVARDEGLRPLTADGVAALIDASTRLAEDKEKLSLRFGIILDYMREADHVAKHRRSATTKSGHVLEAIAAAQHRQGLTRDRMQEGIQRDLIKISTVGSTIGQINGLTVTDLPGSRFGLPVRITARVRMGAGRIVDIEREARLGGPIHSKAVLILSSFLSTRYAPDVPLSLWASLVFEQTYGGVEGDSASLAELCALLSALAEVPLSQSLAVTGSVNQMGEVQPVGGINEKVEGFFDLCVSRGLTGRQGVILPEANIQNLMLRADVISAVEKGQFHIHAVASVDEAIEQLTGLASGARLLNGMFEEGSLNANIEVRLMEFAATRATSRQDENPYQSPESAED